MKSMIFKSQEHLISVDSQLNLNRWHANGQKIGSNVNLEFLKNQQISIIQILKNKKILVCETLRNKIILYDLINGTKEKVFFFEKAISQFATNNLFTLLAVGLDDGEIIIDFLDKDFKYSIDKKHHNSKIISIILNNDYLLVSSANSIYSIFSLKNLHIIKIIKNLSIGPVDFLSQNSVKNMIFYGSYLFCLTNGIQINFYELKIWKEKFSLSISKFGENNNFLIFINKFRHKYIISISNIYDVFIHNVITCRLQHKFELHFVEINTSFLVFKKKLFYFNETNQNLSFKYLKKSKKSKNNDIDLIDALNYYEKKINF
jgi:hypothetical protein